MPTRRAAASASGDEGATSDGGDGGLDHTASSNSAAARPHTRVISHERAAALVDRLARHTPRPEYLQTPGPYTSNYNPDGRRVPFVFRTMERFPPTPPAPSDSLDCNRAQCEERPRNVVITLEERFLGPRSSTKDVAVYDVEGGLRMCEERPRSTLLPPHGAGNVSPGKPAMQPLDLAPPPMGFFDTNDVPGGRISKSGTRDCVNEFMVRRSASPGPIYNPSLSGVECASFAARFSTQARMPSPPSAALTRPGSAPSCRCAKSPESAEDQRIDYTRSMSRLSTWVNAPVASFGRPTSPFVNPNKVLSPPPPEDVAKMMQLGPLSRRRARLRDSAAPKALEGSVIQGSVGAASDEQQALDGTPIEAVHQSGWCDDEDREDGTTMPVKTASSASPNSRPATSTRTASTRSSVSRPTSAALSRVAQRLPPRCDWESPFHQSRIQPAAGVSKENSEGHIKISVVNVLPTSTPAPRADDERVAHSSVCTMRSGGDGSQRRCGGGARGAAPHVEAEALSHPWMDETDYMQLPVMQRVSKNIRELCSLHNAGATRRRQVPGGRSWASSWQRGQQSTNFMRAGGSK